MSLADNYIEFLDIAPMIGIPEPNWDNFFDYYDVPAESRSDFAVAAILKQAQQKLREQPDEESRQRASNS